MRNMWVVMKETYLRHVKSWSFFFMVISPFLFLALSVGIGYLQGSSMAKNSKIAVVTTVPSVEEGLKGTNGINFDYKDEASAQAAIKDEKIKGYLTIDQEDSVLKAVYHGETSLETGIKLAVTNKLNELQYQLNRSAANLSQEQEKRLSQTVDFTEKIDESKENKKIVQTIAAAGLGFFLYMILITYASVTAQEVASEKGTKIMEVVFSSIRASHYFYARMLALLLVILTHIGIYVVGGLAAILLFKDIPILAQSGILNHLGEAFSLNTLLFVLVSLFMYVVLAAFLGSMVSRPEDSGKALSPLMILIIAGFVGVTSLGAAGDNLVLKIGSYIPFISTFFMPFRAINGYASGLEAWISLAITVVFAVTATAFIGRMYASLVLQTDDLGIWKTFKRALAYK
ncbi:sodium ABC transporter permease [Streptococcus oralis subsp. oralis]|uniref:Sodium ABC transporter permease n=2 Tax=Streptococcus oralis TaxID=1303 RepID=A0A1X1I3L2_STROR|nr:MULTISPECIES: ABC transporter permease [Streptococcus]AHZ47092.1 sodium ABC transporter permease [Streptococcus sp. VT 162]MBF1110761.1 ABC transporter permease [Streptococcus sp.]OFO20340.1 sodium ABC transporter permease [Streptococcus sp. HMSC072D05]ORO57668.1 sodium ABC transporter permease [Streptococcus oralis subsp. oralis]ORO67709.1 sodium ABC transporter permease [Streptococcus oralis subsp. oralis]